MSLESVCGRLVEALQGARGSAVIDVETRVVLGGFRLGEASLSDDSADVLVELIESPTYDLTGAVVGNDDSSNDKRDELHITTATEHHFAKRIDRGRALVVVIARHETNVGLVWAQLNAAAQRLDPLVQRWRSERK